MFSLFRYYVDLIDDFGWKIIPAHFIKVSWEQDINFKNKGNDIIHFNSGNGYYYGTFSDVKKNVWF